jgi:hypothetical protein
MTKYKLMLKLIKNRELSCLRDFMGFEKYFAAGVGGFVIGVIAVIFGIFAIFLFAILGALIGAITGWILEMTPILGPAVKNGFTAIFGIADPDLVSIGAMLGFIAGFFKHGHGGGGKEDWSCEEDKDMKEFKKWFKEPKKKRRKR